MDTSVVYPPDLTPPQPQPIGIYGWRKRCVYAFLLVLMAVIVINIALTIWILRVLHFSFRLIAGYKKTAKVGYVVTDKQTGIPGMVFTSKGIQFTEDTEFSNPVYVDEIKSTKNKPLYMMSHQDVQLLQTDDLNKLQSRVVLGSSSVETTCDRFVVQDSNGRLGLKVEGNNIVLGTRDASYPGDIEFSSSVSTPAIRSPSQEALRVESSDSKVHVTGMGGVEVNSHAGDVTVTANDDVFISSTGGAVHVQSPNVYIKNLPKAATLPSSSSFSSFSSSSSSQSDTEIYQLCACANGKLFLAPAVARCEIDRSICDQ